MVRFLVISDLHLHNWSNIPLEHQCSKLWDVFVYALDNNIKYILFCGDAFHTHGRIHTGALRIWNEFLRNLKSSNIKIFGISGNHDHADSKGVITPLDTLDLVGSFLDRQNIADMGGVPVIGFTYSDDSNIVDKYLRTEFPKDCILLLHQGVNGIEVNSKGFTLNEALRPSAIPENIVHCFSGHYHSHKVVSDKLTIPGALFQHNWGDAGEKRGFLDCLLDSKGIHIKHVECPWNEFTKIEYSNLDDMVKYGNQLNLKIIDTPLSIDKKSIENEYGRYRNVIVEYESIEKTKPEIIRSDNFSVEDFFDEYVENRDIPEKNLVIGRQLIGR